MLLNIFIKIVSFFSLAFLVHASDTVEFFHEDLKDLVDQLQTCKQDDNHLDEINTLNANDAALLWCNFIKKKEILKKVESPDCDINSFDEDEIAAIWEDYINRQMLQN